MNVEQFFDDINQTLNYRLDINNNPMVTSHAEIVKGSFLEGAAGYGKTTLESLNNYSDKISGKKIVFNAYTKDRKEYDVPILEKVIPKKEEKTMENEKNEEQAVIDAINAGSCSVDCWVWDVDKKDGYRAKVFAFGNYDNKRMFCTYPNSEWINHAIPYKEPEHEFKPFEKVIFRENKDKKWCCGEFSHIEGEHYVTTAYLEVDYCLPFAGNEKLLGSTNNPE